MSERLNSVQALRATAASAVLAYHVLYVQVHRAGYSHAIPSFGGAGVDLFFVISGFVMVFTSHKAFLTSGAASYFFLRRIIRVAPIYWFYTTLVALPLAFFPSLFTTTNFTWPHVVFSYFFLLSKNSSGVVGTVLQTGWTLCYEMYFYVVFSILLRCSRRLFLPAVCGLFATGIALGHFGLELPVWATVATDPILLEFILGAVIAFWFLKGLCLPSLMSITLIGSAVSVIVLTGNVDLGPWTRVVCWGLPGGAILLGTLSLDRAGMQTPKPIVALGNSSYSLYLVHPFVVAVVGKLWLLGSLTEILPPVLFFLVAFTSSLVLGHVLFLAIEEPTTRFLSRRLQVRRQMRLTA